MTAIRSLATCGLALLLTLPTDSAAAGQDAGAARPELAIGRSADYDYDPPEPGSYRLPPLKVAGDGWVLDETGARHRLSALLDGRITVLGFVYTRCADPTGCPLTLSLMADLYHLSAGDPSLEGALQLLPVSFDPEHDTPETVAFYADSIRDPVQGGADFHFLTAADRAELKPLLAAYDQPVGRKRDPDDPLGPYTHQLRVFLIDAERRVRNIYSLGFLDPRLVMTDVRTLVLEMRGQARQ